MRIYTLWPLLVSMAAADLNCLTVAWWSPVGGLVCYFAPKVFNTTEQAVVQAYNHTIAQASNSFDYSLHYNPITLTYNYIDTASRYSITSANAQLGQELRNITQVTIGFGKETLAQALTVVQLVSFGQVVECFVEQEAKAGISAAYSLVTNQNGQIKNFTNIANLTTERRPASAGSSRRRSIQPLSDQAVAIGRQCIANHFAKPLFLNASNQLQRQGADISDIAALLLPLVDGAAAAGSAAKEGLELAIPGLEDTTSILKLEEGVEEGARFASVEEAEEVQSNLGQKGWQGENCKPCTTPGLRKRSIGLDSSALVSRGVAFSMCCPIGNRGSSNLQDIKPEGVKPEEVQPQPENPGSTAGNESPGSSDVFPGLPTITNLPLRSFDTAEGLSNLVNDFATENSGTIGYSTQLTEISSSKDVMKVIKDAVESPDPTMRDLLNFKKDGFRWTSESGSWLSSTDPRLATLQKWVRQANSDTEGIAMKLAGQDADLGPAFTQGEATVLSTTRLYFIEPTVDPKAFTYYFGLHVDRDLVSFSTSDTLGLSVRTGVETVAPDALTPIVDNSFYLLRGFQWVGKKGTQHAVHLEQAYRTGRPSIVINTARLT